MRSTRASPPSSPTPPAAAPPATPRTSTFARTSAPLIAVRPSSSACWADLLPVPCPLFPSPLPRQQRNRPQRTARSTLDLHRQRDHQGAARGKLVEVRQVLQPQHVRFGRHAVHTEVRRLPVVDGSRV